MTRVKLAAALGASALLVAGCPKPARLDVRGEHRGHVIQHDSWHTKSGRQYYVVVHDGSDGHDWKIILQRSSWDRCLVGAYWPSCKTRKPQ